MTHEESTALPAIENYRAYSSIRVKNGAKLRKNRHLAVYPRFLLKFFITFSLLERYAISIRLTHC